MSRALDQDAAASVMAGDPQAAYNDIVAALNSSTSDMLEIEFLGKSHPLPPGCNVMVDGNGIAIPKLKLVQAFVIARQIFFQCLENFREDKFQDIRNTTAIILLLDPEHITAANARKRVIQKLRTGSGHEVELVLKRELLIIDSFLTSRLHRHTKSPTLWGHRRWLLQILKSINLQHGIQGDLKTVVLVAAERHPRNYYAWLHMRWLMKNFPGEDDSRNSGELNTSSVLAVVKDWCLRHPADTSGWSFLLFCLSSVEASKDARIETNSSICQEVLGLSKSLKWTHESVWVFLRTLVVAGDIHEDQRASFFKNIGETIAAQADNSKTQAILRTAREWCIDYSV